MNAWQPTPALARAVAAGTLPVLGGLLLHRPDLVVLAAPFVVLSAAALARRPRGVPQLEQAVADRWVAEGGTTRVRTTLHGCPGTDQVVVALAPTAYVDTGPARAVAVTTDPADVAPTVDLAVSPRRWGRHGIGAGQVAATSAWGGWGWGPVPLLPTVVTVLPEPAPFDSRAEAPHPVGLVGVNRSRRPGEGTELAGIRPFVAGDRLRRIHWPTSLRTGEVHVVTTSAEQDSAVLLLLDAGVDVGAGVGAGVGATSDPAGRTVPRGSLDATVRAAAALADHHLRVGDRVGVRVLGAHPLAVPIGAGSRHRQRILETLARVRPGEDEIDPRRLHLGLGPGTVVLVLSSLLTPEIVTTVVDLARRGLPVVAVDTLPADAAPRGRGTEADLLRQAWRMRLLERRLRLTEVARTGTPVVRWRGAGSLDEVMRRLSRRAQLPRAVSR